MGKIYLKGSAKTIAGQHGEFLALSLKLEDLQKFVTDKGYVNLCVFKRKETGKYGDTHNVTANEFFIDPAIAESMKAGASAI